MARRKTLVKDIVTTPTAALHNTNILLTPDARSALQTLITALEPHRDFSCSLSRPRTKRESDSAFQAWIPTATNAQKRIAAEISLATTREGALEYLRKEFLKAHPECVPNRKQGRPEWYTPPATRQKMLMGEVVARLINLAGNKLLDELTGDRNAA